MTVTKNDAVARKNVELTMANVRKGSPVLAGMESSSAVKIAGAMYDLQTASSIFWRELCPSFANPPDENRASA